MADDERGRGFVVGEDDNKKYAIGLHSSSKTPLRVIFKEYSKLGPQIFDKEFVLNLGEKELALLGLERRREES